MNYQSLSNWIQIVTGIAILVGLGLVVLELRQSRDIALAQLSSDLFMMRSAQLSVNGREPC